GCEICPPWVLPELSGLQRGTRRWHRLLSSVWPSGSHSPAQSRTVFFRTLSYTAHDLLFGLAPVDQVASVRLPLIFPHRIRTFRYKLPNCPLFCGFADGAHSHAHC